MARPFPGANNRQKPSKHPAPAAVAAVLAGLLGGCQLLPQDTSSPQIRGARWQGLIGLQEGQLVVAPCGEGRRFRLEEDQGLRSDLQQLQWQSGQARAFIDFRAQALQETAGATQGILKLTQLYRLQADAQGCEQPEALPRLQLQVTGIDEPWSLQVAPDGLVLLLPDQPPTPYPFIEEQLPGERLSYSSTANGRDLQLWITAGRCRAPQAGLITPLQARLTLNGRILSGCAYYGRSREPGSSPQG